VGSSTDVTAARSQVTAEVLVDGKLYEPALQQFPNGSQQIGKPSVHNTLRTSVLLSITDPPTTSGTVGLKVIVQPLIVWLWIGGAVMAVGSAMAAFPGKRRLPTDPTSAPVPGAAPPEPEPEPESVPAGVGS
jgi:cytochrome c-type biogenesis protein CcmF